MSIIKVLPDGSGIDSFSGSRVVLDGDTRPGPKLRRKLKKTAPKLSEKDFRELLEIEQEREEFLKKYGNSFF